MTAVNDALSRLETARLHLRPFSEEDLPLLLRIASDRATTRYLYYWGRMGTTPESDARRFLDYALTSRREGRAWEYCPVLKETGEALGEGGIEWVKSEAGTAEIGWILLPEYRGNGYAAEMGRELLRASFEALGAQRVIAHCDSRNVPSRHVMERLGMMPAGLEKEARPAKTPGEKNGDELTFAITLEAWNIQRAWAEYHRLSCRFEDFAPLPPLTDGTVSLQTERLSPADPGKGYVPAYHFNILADGWKVGSIDLRIGYPDSLFYGGQIGYNVDEAWRGRGYAGAACRLLFPVMRLHGMRSAIITNNVENAASRRVCEKLGARLLCQADIPPDHDMYKNGSRRVNVFALDTP